jgi:small subunit ribosomal protein S4e
MARRGIKKHLKRLPAPKHWPIKRKAAKFTTKPRPGPHPREDCFTLAIVLRDVLDHAENMREVKAILSSGQVLVDGKVRKDPRFPVGNMDVIEIRSESTRYRVLPRINGGLLLHAIDDSESKFKLCRIESKQMISGGKLQMTLHDGRNILLPEGQKPSDYSTLDSVKISVPDQELLATIPLKEGSLALITRGRNVGIQGKIIEISHRFGTHASTVMIEDSKGERVQTALEYIFVVGEKKSEIDLDEGGTS